MVDFKALKGDATDNIPGVPGVGDKTAAKLVAEHGNLEGVYADLTGRPRPPAARVRPGVRWIWPRADAAAARASGVSRLSWLVWALRSETNSSFALSDPAPYLVRRLRDMCGR